jgi:hypothetical protein
MCCLGADPPFIRSAVLREDHHNCDDNAQTDEVFRKAASTLFFMHITSSMQAHGEIRYLLQGRHGQGLSHLGFPPGAPAFWISKHANLGRDCQEDSAIGPDIPSLLSPSFSTSLRKARRSSCRNRMKDDPQSELQLLKLRIGTRGYMGSA